MSVFPEFGLAGFLQRHFRDLDNHVTDVLAKRRGNCYVERDFGFPAKAFSSVKRSGEKEAGDPPVMRAQPS